MFILYADESGRPDSHDQKCFVMAGVCVFERQCYWISRELDKIAAVFNPADPTSVELHGNPMRTGRGIFRRFAEAVRHQAILDALTMFTMTPGSNRLFASVVNKQVISPRDPVEYTF